MAPPISTPPLATWTEMSAKMKATTISVACMTQNGNQRRRLLPLPTAGGCPGPTPSLIGWPSDRSGRRARGPSLFDSTGAELWIGGGDDGGRRSDLDDGLGLSVPSSDPPSSRPFLNSFLGRSERPGQLRDLGGAEQNECNNNQDDDALFAEEVGWRAEMHGNVSLVGCATRLDLSGPGRCAGVPQLFGTAPGPDGHLNRPGRLPGRGRPPRPGPRPHPRWRFPSWSWPADGGRHPLRRGRRPRS